MVAGSVLITSALPAQDAPPTRNRIGVNYRPAYNINASFSGIGAMPAASNPGPATGGVDHEYDDGYVRVDSTGNGLGLTWYWGFDNASQVSGDDLLLSSTRGVNDGRSNSSGDFSQGFEFTFARDMGALGRARWGFEAAGNYLNVNIGDRKSVSTSLIRTTDTYALDGLDPFNPLGSGTPYRGTFEGPGTLIDDAPISRAEQVIGGGIVTGRHDIEANLWGLRLGPYVEWPLSQRWSVGLNAGLALVLADSEFRFDESSGGAPVTGSSSKTELLPGGYVGAGVTMRLSEATSVSAGVQYQYLGDLTQTANGREAKLDFGKSVLFTLGFNFSF